MLEYVSRRHRTYRYRTYVQNVLCVHTLVTSSVTGDLPTSQPVARVAGSMPEVCERYGEVLAVLHAAAYVRSLLEHRLDFLSGISCIFLLFLRLLEPPRCYPVSG